MIEEHNKTGATVAGWIVWWLHNVGVVSILLFLVFGGAGFAVTSMHDASVDANYGAAVGVVTVFIAIVLAIEVAIQVLCFFAIKKLTTPANYVWPIVLIVVAFFGNALYFIPGIWGLVINSGNHEIKSSVSRDD
ncbi:hypothetical protein [Secundilactobacillus kimchicus]|uniref:hypothetical protein n=1 Tax=Secundilactobacillus kimchicus TaxID=528209 RepID=UPI0024A9174D|nr:hypothetical protein [Secundilactobacillus kimchicus]